MGGILLLFFLGSGLWEDTLGMEVTAGICEDAKLMTRSDTKMMRLNLRKGGRGYIRLQLAHVAPYIA